MQGTYPQRPPRRRGWANRAEFDKLRRDVIAESRMRDDEDEVLELRVAAIEETIAARWPRRILVRWRLARDLRASVAHFAGETFTEKRSETITSGWIEPVSVAVRQRRPPPATHEAAPSRASLRGAFTRSTGRHR